MGMDVYGKKPTGDDGKYFRNNCWWWRPLWNYCEIVAPKLTSKVKHAQTNDGDGLGNKGSLALAKILREQLASGATAKYEEDYRKTLAELPLVECDICGGTGKRASPPNVGPGNEKCNGCGGKGKREDFATWYPFEAVNVERFTVFLEQSGGFKIC